MIIKTPPKLTNRSAVVKYIEIDLWSWLRDLTIGLFKINFQENFTSFTVRNIKMLAGAEVLIPNGFLSSARGSIPSGRIITRQQGDANIIDGPTIWNATTVSLFNPSANDATISAIFFL